MMENKSVRRGDIFLADLTNYTKGNIILGIRPVVVVQNDMGNYYSPNVIVCAVTSAMKKPMPTHVELKNGAANLEKDSTVMAETILTIEKSDLINYIGTLGKDDIDKVNQAVASSLQLIS